MTVSKTRYTRGILSALHYTLLDRVYQQISNEMGVFLTFHHVMPGAVAEYAPNAHLTVLPEFLDEVIVLLRRRGIDIISIDEAKDRIKAQTSARKFAVLTFDDGYRNTLEYAVPILRKYNTPYTIYIAPGLIDGTADIWWEGLELAIGKSNSLNVETDRGDVVLDCSNTAAKQTAFEFLLAHLIDQVPELEQRQYVRALCEQCDVNLDEHQKQQLMTWDEVVEIKNDALSTIGAHTLNHQALARLPLDKARQEVLDGVKAMHDCIQVNPTHFAYPYGYKSAAGFRDFELLAELGFETAVTTRGGMIFPEHKGHMTALPRISVNGLFQRMRYMAPLTTGLPTRLSTKLRRLDVA